MAAGDRTKLIRDKIRMFTGVNAVAQIPDGLIYKTIDDYQKRIAEDTLCIEESASLTVTSGTASEPTGFYRLKLIEISDTLDLQLIEVDIIEFDHLEKQLLVAAQTPLYYKRWEGTITFFPTPANGTYTIWYYDTPITNVSASVDPETPARFDEAIKYGVLSELLPLVGRDGVYYRNLYFQEIGRAFVAHRNSKTVGLSIYMDDYV